MESDEEQNQPAAQTSFEVEEAEREERNQIWQCFMQYDPDQQGSLRTSDLKQALESLGEKVTETHVFRLISESDPENVGSLTFDQF